MVQSAARVMRIFNNNAVLVSIDGVERVLAGRGIGFGKRPGDFIPAGDAQRQFIEASPDKIDFLTSANALDPQLVDTVTEAVELATSIIEDLDPSVYVVLVDHMAFAVQRHRSGLTIRNKLVEEVKVAFSAEFTAAEIMVHYVNQKLDVELPTDEAAYIALHLNAARSGATVKQPLSEANQLGSIVDLVNRSFGDDKHGNMAELLLTVNGFITRIQQDIWRSNTTTAMVERLLPEEFGLARQIITHIAGPDAHATHIANESAYLAVFLHGWRQVSGTQHT
ncbi:transcriptional antiterminator, BglG family [Arcanobacterium phocae]|uniref:Transcriptional antiterminator, BglG family n=1 Tax=Arcanobacterium phocae TaxID=131112 RepID=A0A1H2LD96_9ACTO|nr:PRD domain-containing protein [Arcanobacterium phocae]SDU79010.1 transcriptional antiterminator, BglG family [Arcanobacterium phocae]